MLLSCGIQNLSVISPHHERYQHSAEETVSIDSLCFFQPCKCACTLYTAIEFFVFGKPKESPLHKEAGSLYFAASRRSILEKSDNSIQILRQNCPTESGGFDTIKCDHFSRAVIRIFLDTKAKKCIKECIYNSHHAALSSWPPCCVYIAVVQRDTTVCQTEDI